MLRAQHDPGGINLPESFLARLHGNGNGRRMRRCGLSRARRRRFANGYESAAMAAGAGLKLLYVFHVTRLRVATDRPLTGFAGLAP